MYKNPQFMCQGGRLYIWFLGMRKKYLQRKVFRLKHMYTTNIKAAQTMLRRCFLSDFMLERISEYHKCGYAMDKGLVKVNSHLHELFGILFHRITKGIFLA